MKKIVQIILDTSDIVHIMYGLDADGNVFKRCRYENGWTDWTPIKN